MADSNQNHPWTTRPRCEDNIHVQGRGDGERGHDGVRMSSRFPVEWHCDDDCGRR
jgi:hypothetical protein